MSQQRLASPLLATALLAGLIGACGRPDSDRASDAETQIALPDTTDMEPQVESRLRERREAILANPRSAEAWGRFGMAAHAHDLWDDAESAYRKAQELDPEDERWPYFLGDVLSIVGTDLVSADELLRRAMALRPDYGPAHMRLGKVLQALDRTDEAAVELERALELEPDLQPARVALAQIRLAEGELEVAARLLEGVLEQAPRHAQALSTLGQVYMRLGRREEAREIAERAKDAASFNLYADPLMSQVVAEGVSSVLLWERAKSFMEAGNYEQAMLGLRQVVALLPENAEVHHQLAVAYGHLGEVDRARYHLERTVDLDPDLASARLQLALLLLEQERPAEAVPHLERLVELAPEDPDAGWLLGKALLQSGALDAALAAFEDTAASAVEVPTWAHNEWGRALVQTAHQEAGMTHFRAALAADPDNAQAHFYVGLVLEGRGAIDEAVGHYCQSVSTEPNAPAADRLQTLRRTCG